MSRPAEEIIIFIWWVVIPALIMLAISQGVRPWLAP